MVGRWVSFAALTVAVAMVAQPAAAAHRILATAGAELGGTSPYANYLVGRYAMMSGDVGTASQKLGAAVAADPGNSALRDDAFQISILNGDIDQAATIAKGVQNPSDTTKLMAPLLGAVTAMKAGRGDAAVKNLDAVQKISPNERDAVLLRPFALAMAGQWKQALDNSGDAALEANDNDRLLAYLIKAERARLYEIKGKRDEADALYKTLYQPGAATFIFGPDYAGFLERQDRKDEARTVWQAIADQTHDAVAIAAVNRIDGTSYSKPALPDLKASTAQALFMSSTISFSEHDANMALASLRLSLYLDDSSDRERVFLGQIEDALKNAPAAEAAWASIPADSPYYNEAILRRITSLKARDANDDAMALLDGILAKDPDNLGFIVEKAGLLHDEQKDTAALALINDRIARAGDKDFTWTAWFLQAVVYDSMDQWDNAEVAIKKAQVLAGQRPEVLNFLGYGWINRGLHVEQGMDLIRQALNITPKSGAIIDSLGWGYYKLGKYDQALSFIEQAVTMEPSDAEINEHLGDVYKALGRDTEAGYEWQRVLTLDATDKQAVEVRAKIDANMKALQISAAEPANDKKN